MNKERFGRAEVSGEGKERGTRCSRCRALPGIGAPTFFSPILRNSDIKFLSPALPLARVLPGENEVAPGRFSAEPNG